ncbi:hypothetical protein AB0J72_31585 [Dactylosporangium sp. NPDC049742]|uniref:hypothetical protein n=1 Tax=Dactylosporangium sp. NPDC049742 TaxID=3154737 RepID=UPI00342FD7E9
MKIGKRGRARLLVVGGVVLFCGLSVLAVRLANAREARESEAELRRYLLLGQQGERAQAEAMLCGGDDTSGSTDLPGMYESGWRMPPIASFTVAGSTDWSSFDGHGTTYQVRLTFTGAAPATITVSVEAKDGGPCIATDVPF